MLLILGSGITTQQDMLRDTLSLSLSLFKQTNSTDLFFSISSQFRILGRACITPEERQTFVRSFSCVRSIITFVLAPHFRSEIKIVKRTQVNGILRRHVGNISGARKRSIF